MGWIPQEPVGVLLKTLESNTFFPTLVVALAKSQTTIHDTNQEMKTVPSPASRENERRKGEERLDWFLAIR